jgi:lipopolysaccharide/colanic/teichoic acid biosynthesis glycosyltransferase
MLMFNKLLIKIGIPALIYFLVTFYTPGIDFDSGKYFSLFSLFILLHTFSFFYYKQYNNQSSDIRTKFQTILVAHILIGFLITFIVSLSSLRSVSRGFIAQILVFPLLANTGLELIKALWNIPSLVKESKRKEHSNESFPPVPHNYFQIILSLLSIPVSFVTVSYLKYQALIINSYTPDILILLAASWIISVGFTNIYMRKRAQNIFHFISPQIKFMIILLTLISIPHYFLRLESISRFLLYGSAMLASILQGIVLIIRHHIGKSRSREIDLYETLLDEHGDLIQEDLKCDNKFANYVTENSQDIRNLLSNIQVMDKRGILEFFSCRQSDVMISEKLSLISASTIETVDLIQAQSVSMLVNHHQLNDQLRLNRYLISCHSAIENGGLIVGVLEPLESIWHSIQNRMPRMMFLIYYPIHFLIHRVLPKIDGLNEIYFSITKGRDRVISRAELFGRLSYCGFKVIAEQNKNGQLLFAAQKAMTVSSEGNPSYGALVKLKRVGTRGETLIIHKLRTMHPYSEFIQKYVFEQSKLDSSGKFKNDFRLTKWGKVFRRYWIDEIPQILNWVRGDVKLVGVRALSFQYFSLYPEDIKKLRSGTKPGLIPPYYADLPQNFDEILDSERKYLKKSLERPLVTDFVYFFKCIMNIIIKGSRSK